MTRKGRGARLAFVPVPRPLEDLNMTTRKSEAAADAAVEEVQAKMDAATDQGFVGVKVDPVPDEEYTLTTGPNSPSSFDNNTTRAAQHAVGGEEKSNA